MVSFYYLENHIYEHLKKSFNVLMIFCIIMLVLYTLYFAKFNLESYRDSRRTMRTVN